MSMPNKLHAILVVACCLCVLVGGTSFEKDVNLNREQKKLLDEFKDSVIRRLPKEYMKKEIYLIKWLRSSNFDLDVAERRLLRNLEWRKEQGMDNIHSENWADMKGDFRYYIDGRDKMGRPFLFVEVKSFDTRRTILQGKGERLVRYVDKGYDEVCGLVREMGEKYGNMTRVNVIANLDGYNPSQHACIRCIPFILRIIFSYLENFPECVDKLILVNTPASANQMLNIAKSILTEEQKSGIKVYGTSKEQWIKALSQDFDLDQLPPSLGGTQIYKGMEENEDY